MYEKHGSWKAFNPSKYYVPYCNINDDSLAAAIARQAREELDYCRGELKRFRRHVNRSEVKGDDTIKSKLGIAYGLWALHAICDSFSGTGNVGRLAKALKHHAEKLERTFEALYQQDRAQVRKAWEDEHERRMAKIGLR